MEKLIDFPSARWTSPEADMDGLALHLADVVGERWEDLTPARKGRLRTYAMLAASLANESKGDRDVS